jgi:hypothetical protein
MYVCSGQYANGSNHNEVAFKTIMVTNIAIKRTVTKQKYKRGRKVGTPVTIVRDLNEIKLAVTELIGAPRPGEGSSVTITLQDMNPLAEKVKEYEELFAEFDVLLTAKMRQPSGVTYTGCWARLWGTPLDMGDTMWVVVSSGADM